MPHHAMCAEVIAIGDELTSGQRLDTNSQWLSQQLDELGVQVAYHTTVGDDLSRIVTVLSTAWERCDLVLASGGLGPTADDLTRQALALAADRPLQTDPDVLDHIRQLFARRQRIMPERNMVQAQFPAGSVPIANPHGTAPGIHLEVVRPGRMPSHIFALPGVPAELREMWTNSVAPALVRRLGPDRPCRSRRMIRCFGAGESEIEQLLPDLVRRGRHPLVGITASQATISLSITADGASIEQCDALIAPTVATIRQCLGNLVFGEGNVELQDVVTQLLARQGRSLAVAEWGTAGLVTDWLGGSSAPGPCLRGGVVIRDRATLQNVLGVAWHAEGSDELWQRELAAQMAHRVRDRLAADIGLAIGPFPDDPALPDPDAATGRVYLAVVDAEQVVTDAVVFASHPAIQRPRCAKQALNLVRLALEART